ncbi:MAG TPA: metal ABC transporter permease [Spirochaetales bacterium]|nr:metal ABC transporter permease [Spirochaetales bacterium]
MRGFVTALLDPSLPFLRNAFFAGILASILFGVLGAIVTVKRIAGLAGAISHAVLGGIGLALFLSAHRIIPGITPLEGAIAFALVSAFIIGGVSLRAKQRVDTVINAIWAVGMSLGVLFMAKTPGYTDPMSYLFGNILFISGRDLLLLAILDIVVVVLAFRFYPQLEASAFDEEFARVRGIPTEWIFLAILSLTAVAVVLLQTFVGLVMVIAMLTLPAGTAANLARNLAGMMILGTVFSFFFSLGGLALSWTYDLPAGAMVVVLAGAVFIGAAVLQMAVNRIKRKIL